MASPYLDIQELLMRELRLYHFPIAVYLFTDEDRLKEFTAKTDYSVPLKPTTFCQWEIAARMQGKTILGTMDNLGCSNSRVSFGWKDIDAAEVKSQLKYCVSPEQAERFLHSKPRMPLGSVKAVAVGPLGTAFMQPDVVHFYCDNLQAYHLAVDYMAGTDTHPLRPMLTISSSACAGNVFSHLEQTFNLCPACSGSYNAGKTERGETNAFIPGPHLQAVVDRLQSRIAATGGSSITRVGDAFPGADICKNCPLIIFKKGGPAPEDCACCESC